MKHSSLRGPSIPHADPLRLEKVGSSTVSRPREIAEANALVQQMAKGIQEMVQYHIKCLEMTPEEALKEALKPLSKDTLQRAARPDCARWYTLGRVAYDDPELAMELWLETRQRARDKFESGILAASALGIKEAWETAQFLAIREAFIEDWQPRGGLELSLIDQLVQSHTLWMYWLEEMQGVHNLILSDRHVLDEEASHKAQDAVYRKDVYRTPRLTEDQMLDRAIKNAERFHLMFSRSLRSLRDLRRFNVNVTVTGAANVNVGPQQVNVTQNANDEPKAGGALGAQ